jgi:hypothetical protein
MTQQMFDDMIGQPPPSAIDVGAIVRRRKRNQWLRRAPVAVAAVLVVALGAAFVGFGGSDTGQAPPAHDKIRLVVDTAAAKAKTAAELTKAYDEAVKAAVPGAEWGGGKPPAVTDEDARPPAQFGFGAGLVVDGRKGDLVIQIVGPYVPVVPSGDVPCSSIDFSNPRKPSPPVSQCFGDRPSYPAEDHNCDNPDGNCTIRTGTNGEKLVVRVWNWGKGNIYTSVAVLLGHGRVLTLESHNDLLTVKQVSAIVSSLASRIE